MSENNSCPHNPCGCVGYGYVPEQEFISAYDVCTALEQGSLFPELDLNCAEYGNICKHNGGGCNE